MENINNKKGFTLVELILYVAIGSIVLLVITSFFQTNLSSRAKIKAISEVDQQG
ncbi:MAG: prepilin-type N-terminal cleavage/methylation domain-containing protein, partial [Candidatus Komeilibacteria bacterium]|nr:prepilin-type N-terminal cleavage/methylation domain-containing protein [Candidatus Komeilibacteria bacterium]